MVFQTNAALPEVPDRVQPSIYDSVAYRRSRRAYTIQCMLEYFIALLLTDAFLSKLLYDVGLDDVQIGIVTSLGTVGFLFQLATLFGARGVRSVKRMVIVFSTVGEVFHLFLYAAPFLPLPAPARTAVVIACLTIYYFLNYYIFNIRYKWANDFVAPDRRGEYSAGKEMLSLMGGMAFTMLIGLMMDRLEGEGRLHAAFALNAAVGLACNAGCFYCLTRIGDGTARATQRAPALRDTLANTLGRKGFRQVVTLSVLLNAGQYLTLGFLGTYKIKELAFSVTAVQLINIAGNLGRFLVSRPLGRYSDRTSYARGVELALCIAAAAFAVNVFSSPAARYCMVLFTILHAVSLAGTGHNMLNIVYTCVPGDYFVYAAAIKNSLSGLAGFGASLLGSAILSRVQAAGSRVLGAPMYAQQLLSLLSFLLMCVAVAYSRRMMARQQR